MFKRHPTMKGAMVLPGCIPDENDAEVTDKQEVTSIRRVVSDLRRSENLSEC